MTRDKIIEKLKDEWKCDAEHIEDGVYIMGRDTVSDRLQGDAIVLVSIDEEENDDIDTGRGFQLVEQLSRLTKIKTVFVHDNFLGCSYSTEFGGKRVQLWGKDA
jgi:hypothetical protein